MYNRVIQPRSTHLGEWTLSSGLGMVFGEMMYDWLGLELAVLFVLLFLHCHFF